MKITPTALSVTQILSSTGEQYVIPSYQRRYSWGYNQLAALWDDIEVLESADTHLLGTIVCLTGSHSAGLNALELVDGQQRLTSLCILLHAMMERLDAEGEADEASDLRRLLSAKALGGTPQPKLLVDSLDAEQFAAHAQSKAPGSIANKRLEEAFSNARSWVADLKLAELGTLLYKFKNQALIIRLDVSEAKDAFKLFETINNRGLRLSPLDIIKNFVLGNAARFGKEQLDLARKQWGLLIGALDGIDTLAFLRAYLGVQTGLRITRSKIIDEFKQLFMSRVTEAANLPESSWYGIEDEEETDEESEDEAGADNEGNGEEDDETSGSIERLSFERFLEELVRHADAYREIHDGETGVPKIDRRLRNLRLIRALQSYAFLLSLRVKGIKDREFENILKLTEALLLRRHICRERANETEQMFATLTRVPPDMVMREVKKAYRESSPGDERFATQFAAARFNGRLQDRSRYCLEQFELEDSPHGETVVNTAADVHLEHIIPQQINSKRAKRLRGDWPDYLGDDVKAQHKRNLWRIGNLTLIAGELNIVASNNPYEPKKKEYRKSGLSITSSIPDDYPEFRFEEVDIRSRELAQRAVDLWPIP